MFRRGVGPRSMFAFSFQLIFRPPLRINCSTQNLAILLGQLFIIYPTIVITLGGYGFTIGILRQKNTTYGRRI